MSLVFDMWTVLPALPATRLSFLSISLLQTIDGQKTSPGVRHFASRRAPGSIFSCQAIVQSTASISLFISLSHWALFPPIRDWTANRGTEVGQLIRLCLPGAGLPQQ